MNTYIIIHQYIIQMANPFYDHNIFAEICKYMSLQELIKLEQLSKYHRDIIRNYSWDHLMVILSDKTLYVLKMYKFMKLDLAHTKITDESVKELKNCHTLDLNWTNVTDESVKELKNCHTFLMFTKVILDNNKNLFHELNEVVDFEHIIKGRKGAVLVDLQNDLIPIVRTTTKYNKPVQQFKPIHFNIIDKIKESTNMNDITFNNALIEIYDDRYCTMGFHSDQSLDLLKDSYIAIYSCYEDPLNTNLRKLVIKNKTSNELSEITMDHNSVILFNLSTNQNHLHKIILENINKNNKWLGITFRLSKTFIHHVNNIPLFHQTTNILKIANEEERKEFYKLRSEENKNLNFEYPDVTYTISISDILSIT